MAGFAIIWAFWQHWEELPWNWTTRSMGRLVAHGDEAIKGLVLKLLVGTVDRLEKEKG